ncbi:caffeic acid 3-O-methyltransferase-like [Rhodamnia argentea]|uniref:Caffeic acid 3-O-methyltransferase-like n=1 Tax=Rhodamnia argentea TaxID=178133 RepID=A0A8B8PP85_9MYRT|nr:caffeic acid 3-O-methyltransferase-like [Rhodamnia argentea]
MSLEDAQVFTSLHEDEDVLSCFEVPSMVFLPMVLKAVFELGILELLAKSGQLSPPDIAARLSIDNPAAPDMIDRMLRLLASYSIVSCTLVEDKGGLPWRLYGLGPQSKYFVDSDGASAVPTHMLLQDKTVLECWHSLKDAVKEGGTDLFTRTHGMNVFDYMSGGREPRFADMFKEGSRARSAIFMPKIAQHYRGFSKAKTVVDVGGGIGETLKIILSRNPHIRAINYDAPHVIVAAPPIPGIEHVGGDMLKAVPKADVHFMKRFLHSRNDELCVKVLKNCWEALPRTGKVVIVEEVMPEYPGTDELSQSTFLMDTNMLRMTPSGKERTRREFADLARASGFHAPKYVLRAYNMWLIELYKKI